MGMATSGLFQIEAHRNSEILAATVLHEMLQIEAVAECAASGT
jgi:hypothetical protein